MTVLPQPPMAASTEAMIATVTATLPLSSPPPSPLTSYSSPLLQILSPPLPVSSSLPISPPPLPTSPTDAGAPLGYIVVMICLRVESPSTSHPLPLPPPIVLPRTSASMVLMRAVAPSTYILAPRSGILSSGTPPSVTPSLLPIPLPTSSPPLILTEERMFPRLCYHLRRGCALLLVPDLRSRSVHLLLLLGLLEALDQITDLLALWMSRLDVTQIGR
ncbi:hypothetical protein Tco_0986210 [Tanacetum coccineum]